MGESNYSASKGAVNAFTRCCAMELARFNVEINLPQLKGDAFWDEARHELDHLMEGRDAQVKVILAKVSNRK